jgi:hypothetical protein
MAPVSSAAPHLNVALSDRRRRDGRADYGRCKKENAVMEHEPRRRTSPWPLWVLAVLALSFGPAAHAFAQPPAAPKADAPYVVEYYYTAKWGYADDFIRLFKKNHYPLLKKQVESGRILKVSAVKPRFHATEDGRWDYRVTLVFKNVLAAHESSGEDALKRQLFPDQDTFQREEQRRFEILLAHWDVPIADVSLEE